MRSHPLLLIFLLSSTVSAQTPLEGSALKLYQQAKDRGRWSSEAEKLKPEICPTSDGKSFFVRWRTVRAPKRWIVSLHGSQGFATDDLAIWAPHLKDREIGLVCLQWWLGTGDRTKDYFTPLEIYREIDLALKKLDVKPGTAMLHGFSRGSANSYAVVAIDAGRGNHYFSLAVASSGGVGLDYPPTRSILDGEFGLRPLRDTRWITVAGARDPNPDRDGIAGMKRVASWLSEQGAVVVESIEDPDNGHGALMRNRKNAQRVLDLFLR